MRVKSEASEGTADMSIMEASPERKKPRDLSQASDPHINQTIRGQNSPSDLELPASPEDRTMLELMTSSTASERPSLPLGNSGKRTVQDEEEILGWSLYKLLMDIMC